MEDGPKTVRVKQFAGLITNASEHALPQGGASEQINIQCVRDGAMDVRLGYRAATFSSGSSAATNIIAMHRMVLGSTEFVFWETAAGALIVENGVS